MSTSFLYGHAILRIYLTKKSSLVMVGWFVLGISPDYFIQVDKFIQVDQKLRLFTHFGYEISSHSSPLGTVFSREERGEMDVFAGCFLSILGTFQ